MSSTPAQHPKAPDASPTCPRCNYWAQHAADHVPIRASKGDWPRGIDQVKAQDILNRAFPQKQRSYG
jgi:hypothetical protein